MVYLELVKPKSKNLKFNDEYYPIAIVKGDGKYQNNLLYINTKIDDNKGSKKIDLPLGNTFEFLPNPMKMKRDVVYVAGASGSGKSYITKQYTEKYHKMFPNRKIYIISQLDEDDTLDSMKGVKPTRIPLDMVKDININNLKDCLFIFDDIDGLPAKEGGNDIQRLVDDIAIAGRAHTDKQGGISMIYITHYITKYKFSRLILNEATYYVLFPQATSVNQLHYILNRYLGFDRKDIRKLRNMQSRSVVFHKNYPMFMIGNHIAQLITDMDE